MKRSTIISYLTDIGAVIGVWAGFLLLLALGGRLGLSLNIATMGEDQNWVSLLRLDDARATAHAFWLIDSRNPLSPWTYLLVKPLILGLYNGLAWVQWIVGLQLAVSCYLLLRGVLGPDGRCFAVATSSGVAVNLSNGYFDHIIWNFQLALVCSLLAVVTYLRFNESGRAHVWLYGLSLCFWAMAFQIYTLQSGAIVAIAFCHFRFWLQSHPSPGRWHVSALRSYVSSAVADLLPFAMVYIMFMMVWASTSVSGGGGVNYVFSAPRLLESLGSGVFHTDTPLFFEILKISPFPRFYPLIGGIVALVIAGFLQVSFGDIVRSDRPRADYAFIILLVLALALPTIVLESGGEGWPPGSRWRMIYQVTSPLLAMAAAGLFLGWHRWLRQSVGIVFSLLMFGWITAALAYNERQAHLTQSEGLVRDAIGQVLNARVAASPTRPLLVILEMDDSFRWFATETLQGIYLKTWFPGAAVEMRFLPSSIYRGLSRTDKVRIMQQGIAWDDAGRSKFYAYKDVAVLRAFDRKVVEQKHLSRQDVIAHNGEWQYGAEYIDLAR